MIREKKMPKPFAIQSDRPWSGYPNQKGLDAIETPMSISIVTPSFNQSAYLESTIRSMILQNYTKLEWVLVDGVSTDGCLDIIEYYRQWIDYVIVEPDRHQYDALNKGFKKTTGEIMGWINSDDLLFPGALATVSNIFSRFPEIDWITSIRPARCNANGILKPCRKLPGFHREPFFHGEYVQGVLPHWSGWIPQESTFWRRSLWLEAGGHLADEFEYAGDYELWNRFMKKADLVGVDFHLGVFRVHQAQKTSVSLDRYIKESIEIFDKYGGKKHAPSRALARKLLTRLPTRLRASLPREWGYSGMIVDSNLNKKCVWV